MQKTGESGRGAVGWCAGETVRGSEREEVGGKQREWLRCASVHNPEREPGTIVARPLGTQSAARGELAVRRPVALAMAAARAARVQPRAVRTRDDDVGVCVAPREDGRVAEREPLVDRPGEARRGEQLAQARRGAQGAMQLMHVCVCVRAFVCAERFVCVKEKICTA